MILLEPDPMRWILKSGGAFLGQKIQEVRGRFSWLALKMEGAAQHSTVLRETWEGSVAHSMHTNGNLSASIPGYWLLLPPQCMALAEAPELHLRRTPPGTMTPELQEFWTRDPNDSMPTFCPVELWGTECLWVGCVKYWQFVQSKVV